MKMKYLVIVSLILAILTIGAVSASDDIAENLTADDSGDKIATIDDDEAIQNSAEDEDVLEDVKASDFDVKIVTDEVNLDDEGKDDKTIFSFYCPNGTNGGSVFARYQDYELDVETDDFDIGPDDIKTYNNITFEDFNIHNIGSYNYKVYYSYYDEMLFEDVELEIGSGTLNVTKTLSPEDFGYNERSNYNEFEGGEYVLEFYNIPCDGTLIIDVNGTQKFSQYLYDDGFDEVTFGVSGLGITEYGTYKILAKFRPVVGDEVNITSFNLTYYYHDYDGGDDYDEEGVEVYGYVDINDPQDTLGAVHDYSGIVGTVTVLINNKQVYAKTFTAADEKNDLSFAVADLNLASYARGKYTVKITYQKPGEALQSDENLVNFTVLPKISWVSEMMAGENAGLLISGPKGISGSATLYNAVEDGDYDYKKGSVFATVKIVDGSARISFANLAEGNYRFFLDYTYGDEKYVSDIDDWHTVNVYKKDARFTSSISATSILVGQNVEVTLKGPASAYDEVEIKVDGVVVKQINSFSGSLKESVPSLTAGTHYVTVMLSGDSFYSNTFEVKVNTPAPAKKDTIKLTLKKVKVKKSAKKLVLQATLKINGKAVKGKVIKFKFNKKTYKAKTNKKGVAKVTIKKKVLKKLKVGKKVKIQATYGKTTKKLTVKVKK